MEFTLDEPARSYLAEFESVTGVSGIDCLSTPERVVILVAPELMADAIGPAGEKTQRFKSRVGKPVTLIKNATDVETFIENLFAPATVYNITMSENTTTVAFVEVAAEDRGIAIGSNGDRIDIARKLAHRHFDVEDIQLL